LKSRHRSWEERRASLEASIDAKTLRISVALAPKRVLASQPKSWRRGDIELGGLPEIGDNIA
jgi:hypothetical protein